jgi:succinylglutamate desuccinylase
MTTEHDRIIGEWRGEAPGPTLLVVAGLHGNEPAGIPACRRVLTRLGDGRRVFRGEIAALAGNLQALALRRRYLDEDLNRIWARARPGRTGKPARSRESVEQAMLLEDVRRILERRRGEVAFLDLHTTSAPGAPFSILAETPRNRWLARALPATMVLGLDARLEGTFLNFINGQGFPAVGFEGGQHEDPGAIDAHERAIWKTLAILGCISHLPDPTGPDSASLALLPPAMPRAVSIVHRHEVRPGDGFVMEPGFRNLQAVEAGQVLARDRLGEITAVCDARILMPLYQDQGNDGFFLAREVSDDG